MSLASSCHMPSTLLTPSLIAFSTSTSASSCRMSTGSLAVFLLNYTTKLFLLSKLSIRRTQCPSQVMGTMTSTHLSPLANYDNLLPNWLLILFSIEPFVTLGPVSLPCILTALNTNTSRVLPCYAYLVSMQRIV